MRRAIKGDCSPQANHDLDLLQHTSLAHAALGSTHLDALLLVKCFQDCLLEAVVDTLHLLVGEVVHGGAGLLAQRHSAAADVVAEGHALAHLVRLCDQRRHDDLCDLVTVANRLDEVQQGLDGLPQPLGVIVGEQKAVAPQHPVAATDGLCAPQVGVRRHRLVGRGRAAGEGDGPQHVLLVEDVVEGEALAVLGGWGFRGRLLRR